MDKRGPKRGNLERNKEICDLILQGATFEEVSKKVNLSNQRIQQIFRREYPKLRSREFGSGKLVQDKVDQRLKEIKKQYNRETYQDLTDLERVQSASFTRKRQNNRIGKKKWEWDLVMSDIHWPKHCPVLGLELDWYSATRKENSPSYDRVDVSKGYVKGNVRIISCRANRIKNDGSAAEHQAIAEYILTHSEG
jgi:hypothetical protein